jgi:hypothetical protein
MISGGRHNWSIGRASHDLKVNSGGTPNRQLISHQNNGKGHTMIAETFNDIQANA